MRLPCVNIDNILNAQYFIPVRDVYAHVAALPGQGRTANAILTCRI